MSSRATSSWGSYKLRNFLELIYRYRACSSNFPLRYGYVNSNIGNNIGYGYSLHQGLHMINHANGGTWKNLDTDISKMKDDMGRTQVPPPDPPRVNFPSWAKWVLGSILSILVPLLKQKWEKIKRIEGEAEIVVEEVGSVAAVVEKVATVAENVSAEVAEKLPENGKLKETALLIEKVSKATAQDAELTKDFIHKVDVLKHDFEDLETMVDKLIPQKSQGK